MFDNEDGASRDSGPMGPGAHPVVDVLDAADAAFEQGLDVGVSSVSDDVLSELLVRAHALAARQAELFARLLGEADSRDLGRRLGASSTTAWAREVLLLRPGVAKSFVDLAHRLTPPAPVDDFAANPAAGPGERGMPSTRQGMTSGEVSVEHARVIAKTMAELPGGISAEDAANAEADLASFAREHDPATLQRLAIHLLHVLDTESLEQREQRAARKRRLRLVNQHDGTVRVTGLLGSEDAAIVRTALDPLTAPQPGEDGERDTRSPEQRSADALVELSRRALSSQTLPTQHGHSTQLLLLANVTTLLGPHAPQTPHDEQAECDGGSVFIVGSDQATTSRDHTTGDTSQPACSRRRWLQDTWARRFGVAPAELGWGGPVSTETARRLTCDAAITPIVLDPHGVPLRVGRAERNVTPGIWTALTARDRGCAFPGCTRPPAWCHAHHIQHWADGGNTDVENLVLLCGHHHRTIHHGGWDVQLDADGHPSSCRRPGSTLSARRAATLDPATTTNRHQRVRAHEPETDTRRARSVPDQTRPLGRQAPTRRTSSSMNRSVPSLRFVEHFTPARLTDPSILDMASRIRVYHEPAIDKEATDPKPRDTDLRVVLKGGRELRHRQSGYLLGMGQDPGIEGRITHKFRRMTAARLSPETQDRITELCANLEHLADLRDLLGTLHATS